MFRLFKNFSKKEQSLSEPEQAISKPEPPADPEDAWYVVKSPSDIVENFFAADLCWDYELNEEVSLSNKLSIILNKPVTLIGNIFFETLILKIDDSFEEFASEEEIEKKYSVGPLILKKDAVNQLVAIGSKDMVMKFIDFYDNLQTKEMEKR